MIIKLRDGIIIDTSKIKSLRDKPIKLYVQFGREIKVDYSIEWYSGEFSIITKQEYKRLNKLLKGE